MNNLELLIIGQSKSGLEAFSNFFNEYGNWRISLASNDEEAIEKFHRHNFEVIIFTGDISNNEERKLRKIFTVQNPDIIIAKHQTSDKGLLVDEIVTALDKLRKAKSPSYSLVDDALKNTSLNIIIQ